MGSSHQVELCHMSTRLCEHIHSTWVPSSRVVCRSQLFFLPDCVMVVWRTKVQCDAHGQVGGCKMDSLGWDGWCLLHKSEFFTICLILVEKLYQNTDSLAWRIHLFSPWYSRGIAWRTWFLTKAGMWGSFNVRSHQNIDNNSNNNLLNFYRANINIKFSFAYYSIVIYLYTSWKYYIQN